MSTTVMGWGLAVERGPGWLLVKPSNPSRDLADHSPLGEQVWSLLECHFVSRLVLDLTDVQILNSHMIGQLLLLFRKIRQRNGVMRLCGLSALNQEVLQMHGLLDRFTTYESLEEAVLGTLPLKPR